MRKIWMFACMLWGVLNAEVICRGILLLGEEEECICGSEIIHDVRGVRFHELYVPKQRLLKEQLEDEFLGQAIDQETIKELKNAIQCFYKSQHYPLTNVQIPEQDITDGILWVNVRESALGRVKVEGNRYTSSELLKCYLDAPVDQPLNTTLLRKNLDFMNRNPFRRVDLVYSPGELPKTTDVTLVVADRRPARVYAGTDNSGIETIDRGRFLAGINIAKVFELDHFFTYQYTSSYDFHHFQAHTAQYLAYLPWRHVLNLYGGYSSVYVDLPFPETRNHGQSYQASGRYIIPFTPYKFLAHEGSFGFDFKRTNNTVEFAETFPTVGPNVNLSQFMLRYEGHFEKDRVRIDYDAEVYYSPGAILGDETDADYASLRPGAKNHWVYGRGLIKYFQKLPYFLCLSITGRGQLASQNLLPSEQLGLGGFDSVRGYDERQLNYDSGCILNVELLTQGLSIISRRGKKTSGKDALQLLAFFDYGTGRNHNMIAGEEKSDYLMGVGPALRYTIDPWITARVDLGYKLHQEPVFTGGNPMWYFSFIASY